MAKQVSLPRPVIDAIERGEKIAAIKQLREATGLGLKEAMHAVEAHARDTRASSRTASDLNQDRGELSVPQAAADALQRGNLIEAIKLIRDANRFDLKQAKQAVDALRHAQPKATAARIPTVVQGDRRSGRWLMAVLIVTVIAAWWLMSR